MRSRPSTRPSARSASPSSARCRSPPAPRPASRTASRRCAPARAGAPRRRARRRPPPGARPTSTRSSSAHAAGRAVRRRRRRTAPPPATAVTAATAPGAETRTGAELDPAADQELRPGVGRLTRPACSTRPPGPNGSDPTLSPMRTTAELREGFQRFYEERGHLRVPSHSLIPPDDDPSTLFIVAGMQPFKPYFLGVREPPAKRAVSAQKVLRAGGKDTDLEDVGRTDRHCSFFEMLGNFSFGDYFKDGAVDFAWEFVTEQMKLDPERLWATVHEGNPALGLGEDTVAIEAWKRVGIPAERIVRLGQGQLLAGGRHRPVRAVLGDLLRPRRGARMRARRLPPGLRVRPLHGVLQPRLHAVRPAAGQRARAAAEPERRHRPRPRARRDGAPGRRLELRHRRLPADHGLGRARVRRRLRRERRWPRRRTACSPTTAAR